MWHGSLPDWLFEMGLSNLTQAKQKSWFQAVIALYRLALDWSLNSLILGRAVELSTGNDEMGNVEMEDEFWQDCFSLWL